MDGEDIRKEVEAERGTLSPGDKADRDGDRVRSFKPLSNREIPVQMKAAPLQSAGVFGTGSGKEIPVPPSPIVKIMASSTIERPYREPTPLDKFSGARPAFVPPLQPPPYQQGFKPDVSIRVGLRPSTVDERKMDSGPLPDRHPRSGGYVGPMGGQEVALRSPSTKTGEKCTVQVQSPIKPPPPLIAHGHLGPIPVKGFEKGKEMVEPRQEPLRPAPSLPPAPVPSQMRPQPPAFEEPKPGISIERMVFLERVERIMASEARIKEIEAENKTLVGMVARLNKELDELKAKLAARS